MPDCFNEVGRLQLKVHHHLQVAPVAIMTMMFRSLSTRCCVAVSKSSLQSPSTVTGLSLCLTLAASQCNFAMAGYRNITYDDTQISDNLKYLGSWTNNGSYNASHVGETGTLSSTKDPTANVTFTFPGEIATYSRGNGTYSFSQSRLTHSTTMAFVGVVGGCTQYVSIAISTALTLSPLTLSIELTMVKSSSECEHLSICIIVLTTMAGRLVL